MINIEQFFKSGELFDGHYKLLRTLSTVGGSADVWLALDMNTIDVEMDEEEGEVRQGSEDTGMLVAIKIYKPKNALDIEGEQQFRDEFKIVYECRHANLVQPTSFSVFRKTPYLVLPFCRQGSSEKLIGRQIPEVRLWQFVADVSAGLDKLHNNIPQIIHQDVKPANVLIDNSNHFAITDFGISSKNGGAHGYYGDEERSGTFAYMAPERFTDGVKPKPESDIWGFGATLCEIITGKVPFGDDGGQAQKRGEEMPKLDNVQEDLKRLIIDCLAFNPEDRPTAAYIMEAARVRQYPIKPPKKRWWPIPLQILITCLLAGGLAYFILKDKKDVVAPQPTIEELYNYALTDLNSDSVKNVKRGLALMDSLAGTKYIPAMYQMALTYGWFKDSVSIKRKHILGIAVNEEDGITNDPQYGTKMAQYLRPILEISDSIYPEINMETAYRLGVYAWLIFPYLQKSQFEETRNYMNQSKKWAKMVNNTEKPKIIDKFLWEVDNYKRQLEILEK